MKTWIKRSLIGLFGVSILVGGLAACGHRHAGWGGTQISAEDAAKWRERMLERAGKELQLDDAQRVQFAKRYTEERRKLEEQLRKEMEEKRKKKEEKQKSFIMIIWVILTWFAKIISTALICITIGFY